jgi:hypothetical protein
MTVTNTGSVTDTYNLAVAGPAGLVATLAQPQVTLAPGASRTVAITTGAVSFALPGPLLLVATATSTGNPAIRNAASASLTIPTTQGVSAQLTPSTQVLPIPRTTSFLVLVDNTGNTQDSYTATITGTNGPVTASLTGLNGQPTQMVSPFILPGLSQGALVLNTDLTSLGEGTVNIQVQSLSNPAMTAAVTAQVSATQTPSPTPNPTPSPSPSPSPTPALVLGDGPTVTAVQRFGFHDQPTHVVLTFNEALDPRLAVNTADYQIIVLGGPGRGGSRVGQHITVLEAGYDPAAHTVTLDPAGLLDVHNRYELIVTGTAGGLADTSGRLMDGKNTGVPGSNFTTVLSFKTLAGPAWGPSRGFSNASLAPHRASVQTSHASPLGRHQPIDRALRHGSRH